MTAAPLDAMRGAETPWVDARQKIGWPGRSAIVIGRFASRLCPDHSVTALPPAPGAPQLAGGSSARLHRTRFVSLLAALALVGCASAPPQGAGRPEAPPGGERDGPDAQPPPDLYSVPDAEPKVEAIRAGGPNKPYEALGRSYVPMALDGPFVERGLGSWYGRKFHGRRTASGEVYNMYEMTAAHPTLPIPSYARIRNPANGREVVVRVNDRGPFHPGRVIDLSYTAALKLDLLRGVAPVEIERITHDEIRSGAWRRGVPDVPMAANSPGRRVAAASTPAAAASAPTPAPANPPMEGAAVRPEPVPATPTATTAAAATAAATAIEPARHTGQAKGYWVQVGAFRERRGAEAFQRRLATELDWLAPLLAIFDEASMHRLQAGPYASRDDAGSTLQRIRDSLKIVPVIVERR